MAGVDWIAETEVIAETPQRGRFTIRLRIGKPYPASDVDWACPVELEGLQPRFPDIHGEDSFQALILAQKIAFNTLRHFVEDGGSLYWPNTLEPLVLDEIFSL